MPAEQHILPPAPDTGAMLRQHIKARRIHQNALARHLGRHKNTILNFKKQGSIQTYILWEICHVLKHDFFAAFSAALPKDFTSDVPADTTKDERIAELEKALEKALTERDLLMQLCKDRP